MISSIGRTEMRRAVVILPNGFTLGNLFFGVWAVVTASRGNFSQAGWYVVFSGVMDAMDGRVARMTRTGSRFGVELDSLVDAVSFGVAPALIVYFAVLQTTAAGWVYAFIYIACAVMRLARFNVEQGGRAKTHFHGLPSPAAGMTLASYYWFSQTSLYTQTAVGQLPWHQVMQWLLLLLSFLMISHVLYPAVPTIGLRSVRGVVGLLLIVGVFALLVVGRQEYLFPALLLYVAWGLVKTVFLGLLDRVPTGDPLDDPDEPGEAEARPVSLAESAAGRRRRRRRRPPPTPPYPSQMSDAGE